MTIMLYRVGRFCSRHAKGVIVAWILGSLLLIVAGNRLGSGSNDAINVNGMDSMVAQTLLNREFPGMSGDPSRVVVSVSSGKLSDTANADAIHKSEDALEKVSGVTAVSDPLADGSEAINDSGQIAYLGVTVDSAAKVTEVAPAVLAAMQPAIDAGIDVAIGGQLGQQLSKSPVHGSEVIGIIMAIIVMMLAFGSAVAMGVPIVTAILSVGSGLALLKLLGNVFDLPEVATTLATMIGLGVGIDYGLFLVVRFRRLLGQGMSVEEAVGRTAGSSGSAVFFAAGTVVVAVCGLGFSGVSFVGWLGYSAAIVVAVSLLSAITLTPALLGWLGPNINRLSLPGRKHAASRHIGAEELDNTIWARLAGWVAARPWQTASVTLVVLLTLAAPTLFLQLGQMDAGRLPATTQARQAYDTLAKGFGPGANGPLRVVVELYQPAAAPKGTTVASGTDPRTMDLRLVQLKATLADVPGVRTVGDPVVSADAAVAVYAVTQEYSPSDEKTVQLVSTLRNTVLPTALAGTGAEGHVGGLTADKSDLAARIAQRLPFLILGVVLLACILMLLAFRSIWLAVKAAVMNLISIAAAYGVVVAVFQWGWGIGLLGLDGPVPIESYVPMMMFAILFGLSMDYEVFLLTSVQEHWHATNDNTRAVRLGLADTGQIISSAALIMVSVFASFLINNNPIVKMFGLGLSVAVAVDATIVRCLLVPAAMVLFGKKQWELPARLDALLPRIAIDPDPVAFDQYTAGTSATPVAQRPSGIGTGGAVTGVLLGLAVVIAARRAGGLEAAAAAVVPLLLGALIAVVATGGERSASRILGIGTSLTARAGGLCLGVGVAALMTTLAENRFPYLPSAAAVTIALTLLLALVPSLVSGGRIPVMATYAGAGGFIVAWGVLATTPTEVAAQVLLGSAIGFVLALVGGVLRRLGAPLSRLRPRRAAPVVQPPAVTEADTTTDLSELFDSEEPDPERQTAEVAGMGREDS
jgi:RND superfamily putative drug exporter